MLEKHTDLLILWIDNILNITHYDLTFKLVELDHFLLLSDVLRVDLRWFAEVHGLLDFGDAVDLLGLHVLDFFNFFLD